MVLGIILCDEFFNSTSLQFSSPKGSPGYEHQRQFKELFPEQAESQDMFAIFTCNPCISTEMSDQFQVYSLLYNLTLELSDKLWYYDERHDNILNNISSYWTYTQEDLKQQYFSVKTSRSLIMQISYNSIKSRAKGQLIDYANTHVEAMNDPNLPYMFSLTGYGVLTNALRHNSYRDLVQYDFVLLLLALLFCGFQIKNFFLIVIPLINVCVTIAVSFLFLLLMDMETGHVVPRIMFGVCSAVTLLNTMNLLTLFKEEVRKDDCMEEHRKQNKAQTVLNALAESGRVFPKITCIVTVILLVNSIGLWIIGYPSSMADSSAAGLTMAILVSSAVNLTITPALLMVAPKYFGDFNSLDKIREFSKQWRTRKNGESRDGESPFQRLPVYQSQRLQISCWKAVGDVATLFPLYLIVLVLGFGFMLVFGSEIFSYQQNIDNTNIYPLDADAYRAYVELLLDFDPGIMSPFYIVAFTGKAQGVRSSFYFNETCELITMLLEEVDNLPHESVTGIMYPQPMDQCISWNEAQAMLNMTGGEYSINWSFLVNAENESASVIKLYTPFDPWASKSKEFINQARAILTKFTSKYGYQYFLVGGSVAEYDTVEVIFRRFFIGLPIIVALLCLTITVIYRAVFQMLRVFLGLVGLFAVYGIVIGTKNSGWFREWGILSYDENTPYGVNEENGCLYWYSLLISLLFNLSFSFNYEILMFSRVYECRSHGYSSQASIIRSLHSRGNNVIFSAVIVSICFTSILISDVPMYNELGFLIISGVLFDAFVIRILIMSALTTLFGKLNWWPKKMPTTNLLNCFVDENQLLMSRDLHMQTEVYGGNRSAERIVSSIQRVGHQSYYSDSDYEPPLFN